MKKEKILSLWAINAELNIGAAIKELDIASESGIQGVIFHPRYYPNLPPFLSAEYYQKVDSLIKYCQSKELEFWIYDENGWPSGTADGRVMKQNPDFRKEWIELRTDTAAEDGFYSSAIVENQKVGFSYCYESQPSSIDEEAVQAFIKIVYEGYRKGLSPEAFDYVSGFFSDETALPINKTHPSIPYSTKLAEKYSAIMKRDLKEDIAALFFDDVFAQDRTAQIRITFWELAAAELGRCFYGQLSQWCTNHQKRFTAHLRGEENIALSIPFSGSAAQVLRMVDIPMVDSLERYQENPFFPRIASGLAAQFGDGNSFCEAMGGSGWGIEPRDLIRYYRWLAENQINISCLHLNQLCLKAEALRDWPPSMPTHLNWQPLFRDVLAEVHGIYAKVRQQTIEPVLYIAPVRKVMAAYQAWELSVSNRHKGAVQPDTAATRISLANNACLKKLQQQYPTIHVLDEKLFEENRKKTTGGVVIGKMTYQHVFADPDCLFFDEEAAEAVSDLPEIRKRDTVKNVQKPFAELSCPQTAWQAAATNENLWPFRENYFVDKQLLAEIEIKSWNTLTLRSSDALRKVEVNGWQFDRVTGRYGDHYLYEIPKEAIHPGKNQFKLYAAEDEIQPFCWLMGDFKVGLADLKEQKNGLFADAAYLYYEEQPSSGSDLTRAGYPFVSKKIVLTKEFELAETHGKLELRFSEFQADGALVKIGQQELSYWPEKQTPLIFCDLSTGKQQLQLTVYPSTFNNYGPFRYLGGDSPVVSPFQYFGEKSIMDDRKLPEVIEHDGYNMKLSKIGEVIFGKWMDQ